MTRVRRVPGWLVALLFFGVPLLEIVVLLQVGRAIGPWWTILLLLADSVFGAWLIKREGRRAARALVRALETGQMPARELADGILILVGGTLMLSPGFVTDVFGMLMILPFTRPLARRVLTRAVAARLLPPHDPPGGGTRPGGPGPRGPRPGPDAGRPRTGPDVVQGEVVDDD
jgi:UPF0716 protein FxsA